MDNGAYFSEVPRGSRLCTWRAEVRCGAIAFFPEVPHKRRRTWCKKDDARKNWSRNSSLPSQLRSQHHHLAARAHTHTHITQITATATGAALCPPATRLPRCEQFVRPCPLDVLDNLFERLAAAMVEGLFLSIVGMYMLRVATRIDQFFSLHGT